MNYSGKQNSTVRVFCEPTITSINSWDTSDPGTLSSLHLPPPPHLITFQNVAQFQLKTHVFNIVRATIVSEVADDHPTKYKMYPLFA